jgi:hypothetical protein
MLGDLTGRAEPVIVRVDLPGGKKSQPLAIEVTCSRQAYDTNGFHEGTESATFRYRLVLAHATEAMPPVGPRTDGSTIPLDCGPLREADVRALAPYLVELTGNGPTMRDIDTPAEAFYDCACGASYDGKRSTGGKRLSKNHTEHDHETRYCPPDNDELYQLLCPTSDGWNWRDSEEDAAKRPVPYYVWVFSPAGKGFDPAVSCWRLVKVSSLEE